MSETVGEVELEDNVLVIRRIHVVLSTKTWSCTEKPQLAFMVSCGQMSIYRTLKPAIAMSTELVFEALPA